MTEVKKRVSGNYLKRHRKTAGLSQRELARILGYRHQGQISRHERSHTVPPLSNALGYEVIFRVPLSTMFAGLHGVIAKAVEANLTTLEDDLQHVREGGGPGAKSATEKLKWLAARRA